ncbi:apospory-associated protein c [Aspergillus eucalypticola CBS 122712]|uniref:Glucose-6-phosphate 1-epimerase n=1 Tax=Aspergillus eucalypticola (strain CBS 122712 / IBT 29274) TaxID=1448314 RepID=A0A317UY22_ASPEC|nr:apospory-associated protein c [Aspergillus eucalypticola CBS 122712]PWY66954.1 apospory-associated protein c [Aspergillus eucalypticola CBS 122712]
MDRSNKPAAIGVGASLPQPTISLRDNTVEATLPTGESVTVYLYGATVTSWKLANGKEQLFVSEKANLDGSKPIRGGIPVVFPVFGPPPFNHATSALPQHGFARNSNWEFLGKSSSEAFGRDRKEGEDAVKLDFGLSHPMLSKEFQKAWPYKFGLVYSVTLTKGSLETSLQVQNQGEQNFDFQVLMHTYLSVEDITNVRVKNLQQKEYLDKTQGGAAITETSEAVEINKETDRVYKALDPKVPIIVSTASDDQPLFSITREALTDVVVWNPWIEKAKGMADFGPDEAYKNMLCVEAGSVAGWQTLEAGESWEGGQTIRPRL